ncbi:MAG TPA: TonB-dependent receptor [Polyangiaceae bacterium]|nr:TonB-dependent receptor [Polyangiaceae bacterium]
MNPSGLRPRAASGRVLACWLLGSARALAQPTPEAEGPPAAAAPDAAQPDPRSAGVKPPELLSPSQPDYPEEARAQGLEARVTLRLDIDRDGAVTHAEVVERRGHGFDEAALRAAQRLRFTAAQRDGRAIPVRILFHYDFQLERAPAVVSSAFRGAIRSAEGLALAAARIELIQNGALLYRADSDAQGAFELQGLEPGNYELSISAPGFRSFTGPLRLEGGQEAQASYVLEAELAAQPPIEVTVQGERLPNDISYHRVAARELAHVAGNRGDALQALENLPGVAHSPELSGLLIVHGTSPESTQIFVDGTYVPGMYHFGGLSSVVPTDMLDHADFFTGNYGARYGRGVGGIVDIAIRRAHPDGEYHGLFQADLLDARAQLEGPLPGPERWSFIAGARRSHVDLWLIPLLDSQDTSFQAAPVYYDYQAFVEHEQRDSQLRFGVFGSDDRLRLTNRASVSGGQFDQANAFWNVQMLHEARLAPALQERSVVSFGYFLQRFSVSTLHVETRAYPIIARSELSAQLSDRLELRLGPDLLYAPLHSKFAVPEETGPGTPDSGSFLLRPPRIFSDGSAYFRPAFYAELRAEPLPGLELLPGVRIDYTHDTGRVDLSPRISARYELGSTPRKTTLKAAFGFFHEPPQVRQTLEGYGTDDLDSVRALQSSLGVEQQLSRQLSLSVQGFHLDLAELITSRPNAEGRLEYQNTAAGKVIGAELMLRYEPDEHFFGWLSYTLSRSTRRWGPGEPEMLFGFDQTHVLAAVGSYRLGRGWELGGRLRAVSGNPTTPCISGLYSAFENAYLCVNGPFQSQRAAPFYQLDLRVEKRWRWSEQAGITAYLEVINATARENKDSIVYSFDYSQHGYVSSNLPLLPNLGARFDF